MTDLPGLDSLQLLMLLWSYLPFWGLVKCQKAQLTFFWVVFSAVWGIWHHGTVSAFLVASWGILLYLIFSWAGKYGWCNGQTPLCFFFPASFLAYLCKQILPIVQWTKAHPGPGSDFPGDPCSGVRLAWAICCPGPVGCVLDRIVERRMAIDIRSDRVSRRVPGVMSTGGGKHLPYVLKAYE